MGKCFMLGIRRSAQATPGTRGRALLNPPPGQPWGLGGLRPDGAGPSRMWGRGGVVKDPVKRDGRAWWCLPTPSAQPLLNAQPPSDLL